MSFYQILSSIALKHAAAPYTATVAGRFQESAAFVEVLGLGFLNLTTTPHLGPTLTTLSSDLACSATVTAATNSLTWPEVLQLQVKYVKLWVLESD